MNMESDPRNGDIVVKLPTYISLALGSAVIRSLLGELPMDGTAVPVWDAIGLTPGTLGVDGCGGKDGDGGVNTSSVGEIFERIRQLQPPEEDEDESDVGSDDNGSDNDGSDDGSDEGSDDGLGSVIEEDTT